VAIPSSAIAAANKELSGVYEEIASGERQKGPYIDLKQPSQRCKIGRRAEEYGMIITMRYFKINQTNCLTAKEQV